MPQIRTIGLIAIFLAGSLLEFPTETSAREKWLYGKSENFEFLSNISKSRTLASIREFEKFRYGFLSIFPMFDIPGRKPVYVYLFNSGKTFAKYKSLYKGKPRIGAGVFISDPYQPLIAMNMEWDADFRKKMIYHEYIHHLTGIHPTDYPLWWTEGIAELFSTVVLKEDRIVFGEVIPYQVDLLVRNRLIPLDRFFAVGKDSPFYHDREKMALFYSQSWAFVHFCTFAKDSPYDSQYRAFLKRILLGNDIESAFRDSFQMEYREFQKKFKHGIISGFFRKISANLRGFDENQKIEIGPAEEKQTAFALGKLLVHMDRPIDALPFLNRALELEPDWPRPYEALGYMALETKGEGDAQSYFLKAEERDSENPFVYYSLAAFGKSIGEEHSSSPAPDAETVDRTKDAVKRLTRAILLNPYYFDAYELLVSIALESGSGAGPNLLDGLKQGRRLGRYDATFAFKTSILEHRSGRPEEAREALRTFLDDRVGDTLRKQAALLWLETGLELPESARDWFQSITEEELADADAKLGFRLRRGVLPNYAEAFRCFTRAAKKGNHLAQYGIGLSHLEGHAVAQNYEEGLKWLGLAANNGLQKAQIRLAHIHLSGKGVPRDYKEAIFWFRKAANAGDLRSQNSLAWALSTSPDETIRDGKEAVKYAKMALAQKDIPSILDTLAAAYAEMGRFDAAIRTQKKALAQLRQGSPRRSGFEDRLESFKRKQPWREHE